ncbi:MAG: hypothetical protein M3R70_13765 [Actinomycetota bacterium]|nr:hypothetical protein [Actinomycetota bacterium]
MPPDPPRSDEDEVEVEAIFARLRAEVLGRPSDEPVDGPSPAREEAERTWPVSAERPFLSPPGKRGRIRGLLLAPVKGPLRRAMRWYVEPAWAEQRRFNAAVLRLLDDLSEKTSRGRDV